MVLNSKFILERAKKNIAPLVPVEGMREWLEVFVDTYFNDLDSKTFDPIIKRTAKIYAYWSLLDALPLENDLDRQMMESLKRSINNELAWAITITLESMPDLNIDNERLQTQSYFDLFKGILKKQALEINELLPFFNEEEVTFSFSECENIEEVEKKIFENLLLEVAERVFEVNAEVFVEMSNRLSEVESATKKEKYMAALSLIADNFFIQNILHQEKLRKSNQGETPSDLLEYIFPRDCYWAGIKNILENIELHGLEAVDYVEEWCEGSGRRNFIRLTFASPKDQDQLWQFFEKVNFFRKMHQEVMPPFPNIYDPDSGKLLEEQALAYIESINDAFDGRVNEVKIPQSGGIFKGFSISN